MKRCSDCNNIIMGDDFMCPKCGSSRISLIEDESIKKEEDLSFRIEKIPSTGFGSFDKELSTNKTFIIVGIIMMIAPSIFCFPQLFVMKYVDNPDELFSVFIKPFLFIWAFLALIGLIMFIISFHESRKIKYLLKNGILIKNIPFTIVLKSQLFTRVKIDYKDEFGNNHFFEGKLKGNYSHSDWICDVLVDPNNYKKYIVMDDIS